MTTLASASAATSVEDLKQWSSASDVAASRAAQRRRLLTVLSLVVFFGLWQLSGLFLNPLLLSTPTNIVRDMVLIVSQGYIFTALFQGFSEMYVGWGAALVVGLSMGVLMGRYRFMERVLGFYVDFLNGTPGIALVPLIIIWLGLGETSRVVFIFIITLWPILLNTLAGVKNVNRGYMEVGMTFGLDERRILRSISLPAAVPYILAGLRISAGRAVLGVIIAQIEVALVGVGRLLLTYGESFQTGHFFAILLISALFGVVNVQIIRFIQRAWFPWVAATAAGTR